MVFKHTRRKSIAPHEIAIRQNRATRNILRIRQNVLRSYDLTTPEWFILGVAHDHAAKTGVKVGDIASALDVQSTYITGNLRRLLLKGLAQATVHPDDKRARCITTTKQGAALLQAINEELGSQFDSLLSDAPDTNIRGYLGVLELLATGPKN